MFPTWDFCVIQTDTRFCYIGVAWKSKDKYIYGFMKFS